MRMKTTSASGIAMLLTLTIWATSHATGVMAQANYMPPDSRCYDNTGRVKPIDSDGSIMCDGLTPEQNSDQYYAVVVGAFPLYKPASNEVRWLKALEFINTGGMLFYHLRVTTAPGSFVTTSTPSCRFFPNSQFGFDVSNTTFKVDADKNGIYEADWHINKAYAGPGEGHMRETGSVIVECKGVPRAETSRAGTP